MPALQPPDTIRLQAATGWVGLGDYAAYDELESISAANRAHPSVLQVRLQIYANLEKCAAALDFASAIVKMVPDWPSGWIYRAGSLTALNRHQEVYETFVEAATWFPSDKSFCHSLG